jgi:hypothetical protein
VDQPASLKLSMLAISTSLRCDMGIEFVKLRSSLSGGILCKLVVGQRGQVFVYKVSPSTGT